MQKFSKFSTVWKYTNLNSNIVSCVEDHNTWSQNGKCMQNHPFTLLLLCMCSAVSKLSQGMGRKAGKKEEKVQSARKQGQGVQTAWKLDGMEGMQHQKEQEVGGGRGEECWRARWNSPVLSMRHGSPTENRTKLSFDSMPRTGLYNRTVWGKKPKRYGHPTLPSHLVQNSSPSICDHRVTAIAF